MPDPGLGRQLFQRRERVPAAPRAKVVSQPQPVSRSVDAPKEGGELFRWLAPAAGKISDLQCVIGKQEGPVKLHVELARAGVTHSTEFLVKGTPWATEETFDVEKGDLITVLALEGGNPQRFDIAFLFLQSGKGRKLDVDAERAEAMEPEA